MDHDATAQRHARAGGAEAYLDKPETYYAGARADYVAELPANPEAAILELGCAEGGTGALALAQGKAGSYVGIELHEPSAARARGRLSEVHIGNVEDMELPFAPASFDALIISEVLEHLVDPWAVTHKLGQFVRPGGMVLASSPNISHYRVIRQLLGGRWELADRGVMDRTHLRWFTPTSFGELFRQAGFEPEEIRPVTPPALRTRVINALTGGRLSHLFMVQISLRGRKTDSQG